MRWATVAADRLPVGQNTHLGTKDPLQDGVGQSTMPHTRGETTSLRLFVVGHTNNASCFQNSDVGQSLPSTLQWKLSIRPWASWAISVDVTPRPRRALARPLLRESHINALDKEHTVMPISPRWSETFPCSGPWNTTAGKLDTATLLSNHRAFRKGGPVLGRENPWRHGRSLARAML